MDAISAKALVLNEFVVKGTDYSNINTSGVYLGGFALGADLYENSFYKGDFMYRNSAGVIQSVFNTKYGQNKSPTNIGNISNYSRNARRAIMTTKTLRATSNVLLVAGARWIGEKLHMLMLQTTEQNCNCRKIRGEYNSNNDCNLYTRCRMGGRCHLLRY